MAAVLEGGSPTITPKDSHSLPVTAILRYEIEEEEDEREHGGESGGRVGGVASAGAGV